MWSQALLCTGSVNHCIHCACMRSFVRAPFLHTATKWSVLQPKGRQKLQFGCDTDKRLLFREGGVVHHARVFIVGAGPGLKGSASLRGSIGKS